MKCLLQHEWGWPRKRGDRDMQVCINCGIERESKVHFDGPRYLKTQEGIPNFSTSTAATAAKAKRAARAIKVRSIRSVA